MAAFGSKPVSQESKVDTPRGFLASIPHRKAGLISENATVLKRGGVGGWRVFRVLRLLETRNMNFRRLGITVIGDAAFD